MKTKTETEAPDGSSLQRLVRHWKMERLRWLRAKKQPCHSDTFKDHAQCYADVYERCAKELNQCMERMPNDQAQAQPPTATPERKGDDQ